ncbi:hypothetical protein HYW99_00290 [Candidatus Woesearchaeota archaeon]|nr:hypothetical protein [Candidatus Woesearchaeota archaeon]
MENKVFTIELVMYMPNQNSLLIRTEPLVAFATISDAIETLKRLVEEDKESGSYTYSAIVKPYQVRYLSRDAATRVDYGVQGGELEKVYHGLLLKDLQGTEMQVTPSNPRIEVLKEGKWVPKEELTSAGWVSLEERLKK